MMVFFLHIYDMITRLHLINLVFLLIPGINRAQEIPFQELLQVFVQSKPVDKEMFVQQKGFNLLIDKDTLKWKESRYSYDSGTSGFSGILDLVYTDSSLVFCSFDIYSDSVHEIVQSDMNRLGFQLMQNGVEGDFITSVYSDMRITVVEGYKALNHPSGKGTFPFYRFSIFQKFSEFDKSKGLKREYELLGKDSVLVAASISEDGVLNGERVLYYPNGTVRRNENWKIGHLYGVTSEFTPSGMLWHTIQYANDLRIGQEKWYDVHGQVVAAKSWDKDLPTGSYWKKWEGVEVSSWNYVNGQIEGPGIIAIYPSRTTDSLNTKPENLEAVNFVNGQKQGIAIGLNLERNDTLYRCTYKDGVLDGSFEVFNNGVLSESSNWINGVKDGVSRYYITSGELKGEVYRLASFKNGLLNGIEKRYYTHKEGVSDTLWFPITYQVKNLDGALHGDFEIQFEDEGFTFHGIYENGELNGYSEKIYVVESDTLFENGWYLNGVKDSVWEAGNQSRSFYSQQFYRKGAKADEWTVFHYDTLVETWKYHDNGYIYYYSTLFGKDNIIEYVIDSIDAERILVTATYSDEKSTHTYEYYRSVNLQAAPDFLKTAFHFSNSEELAKAAQGKYIETRGNVVRSYQKNEQGVWCQLDEYNAKKEILQRNDSMSLAWNPVYFEEKGKPYTGEIKTTNGVEIIQVKNGVRHGWTERMNRQTDERQRIYYVRGKSIYRWPLR